MEILNYKKMFASHRDVGDKKSEVEENQVNLKQTYTINLECEAIAATLAYNLFIKVLQNPEESYFCALNAHKKFLLARFDNVWLMSKSVLKVVIFDMRKLFEQTDLSVIVDRQSSVLGLSTFIGLLYDKHLVDANVTLAWIEEVLNPKYLHVSRLNMLQVIKERVKMAIENGDMSNVTAKLNKAILDANLYEDENHEIVTASKEQIKEFNRHARRVSDKNPHDIYTKCVNSSHVYLNQAKKFLDFIINEPQDMSIYVEVNELFRQHNEQLSDEFERALVEKHINIRDVSNQNIYLLWLTKFVAELCLKRSSDLSKFILPLADNLMYKSEGSTIVFMLIFWKLSSKLKQNSPETYHQCLAYVKQIDLKIIKGVDDSQFVNDDTINDYFALHISLDYKLKIDEFSLNRAKSIFNSAFLRPEHIYLLKARFGNSIADRLLRVHLEYLTEIKFYSVRIFQLMQFLKTTAKLYEHDFVTNVVIGKIMKALAIDCNVEALEYFCHQVSDKAKEDTDQSFNDFKQHILQVTKPYDICTPQTYYDHLMDVINGRTSVNAFDYNNIQNFSLKEYTATLTLEAICKAELRDLAPEICSKFQEAHPQFRNILTDFLDEYIEAMFWKNSKDLFLTTKMEPGAAFIGALYNSEFPEKDSKLAEKILAKCKNLFHEENQASASWKSFANIIKSISKFTLRSKSLFCEYILTLELFFGAIERKELDSETRKSLQDAIDEMDRDLGFISSWKANPSFKFLFDSIILLEESENGRFIMCEKWICFEDGCVPPLKVTNPEQCAQYYLCNALSNENIHFYVYFHLMERDLPNHREHIKKIEPYLLKLCIETTKKQFSNHKGIKDHEKITLSLIVAFLFNFKIMSLNDFTKCIEYTMDGIVNNFSPSNVRCFENLLDTASVMERLESEASDYFVRRIKEFGDAIEMRGNNFRDYVEVKNKPLKLADLRTKKPDVAAQMIFDSILKQENLTDADLENYYKFCLQITKKHANFNSVLAKTIWITANLNVNGLLIENLPWKGLGNLAYFLGLLLNISETHNLLNYFLVLLHHRLHVEMQPFGCPKYASLYLRVVKHFSQVIEGDQLRILDQIYFSMNFSCEEYKKTCQELFELFDNRFPIKIRSDKVAPSFRAYMQNTLEGKETFGVYLSLSVNNNAEFGKYFLEIAISRPYSRAKRFAEDIGAFLGLGNEQYVSEYHMVLDNSNTPGRQIVTEVVKLIRSTFENFNSIESARRAIGLTKFVCELFKMNQIISRQEFIGYAKKMNEIAIKKPTKCNAICFLNFFSIVKADSYLKKQVLPTMSSTHEEIQQRFHLSVAEFSDVMLDSIDRENELELAELKNRKYKTFDELLSSVNDENFKLDKFDFKSLQRAHLANYAQQIVTKSLKYAKVPPLMTAICQKVQQVHPEFMGILEAKVFDVFSKSLTSNKLPRVVTLIAELFKVDLISGARIEGFLKLFELKNDYNSVIKYFKLMRQTIRAKCWPLYLSRLDLCYDLQYNIAHLKRDCEEMLEEFYEELQTVDDENLVGVYPRFKWMINNTTKNEPSEMFYKIGIPAASAKFFFINMIAFPEALNEFFIVYKSLYKLEGGSIENSKSGMKFPEELIKLCVNSLQERLLHNKAIADDQIELIAHFLFNCALYKSIKIEYYLKCIEIVLNSVAKSVDNTKIECFRIICNGNDSLELPSQLKRRIRLVKNFLVSFRKQETVEVSSEALQFDQLKQKRPEVCAQMIVDSVLKMKNPSTAILHKYAQFCAAFDKSKSSLHHELVKYMSHTATILAMAPQVRDFDWNLIRKFSQFLNCLLVDFCRIQNYLFDHLTHRVFEEKLGLAEFAEFALERLKENSDFTLTVYTANIDQIYAYIDASNDDYNAKRLEILKVVEKCCAVVEENSNMLIRPSFQRLIKQIMMSEEPTQSTFTNDDDNHHAQFFVMNAFVHRNFKAFVREMKRWKETKPEDYKFRPATEPEFLDQVIKAIREEFCELFNRDPLTLMIVLENACKFIAELYKTDLYPSKDYKSCVQKIVAVAQKNPSQIMLKCLEHIAIDNLSVMKEKGDALLAAFCEEAYIEFPVTTKSAKIKEEANSTAVKQQNETEGTSENTKKKRKRRKHKKTKTNEGETSSASNDVEESLKTEESTEDDIKQQDPVEEPPTEEEPHSPFDIDTFRLFIHELQFFSHDELIERVKMIEIENEQCLRVMSRELLSEFSMHYDINFVEIATTIDEYLKVKPEIEKNFKEILADEIVRILKAKLSEGFDFDASLIDFDDKQQDPAPEFPQVQSNLPEIQSEVKKVKNLLKFSLELFIADWIAQEKLENLLDFLTAGKNLKNLKVVTEIVKMTAHKLSYDKVDAEIAKFMKLPDSTRTISQFSFTAETIKHLQAVKMSSKTPKVLVDSLESCNLEEFSLICSKVESSERVMDQILQKFVAQATLNDPNEFARSASKLSAQSQAKLMKICIVKVQSLVESESSELWEVFGVFDFIAALQTAGIAKVSHLDALFEVLMREDSKFVKVFIENLGAKFENSHREIIEHYFDAIETKLKVVKGSQRRVLEDLIELLASGWKVTEDLQKQFKFEVFLSTLNEGNFDWMLMKLRKTAHDEFTDLIRVLWKFLIKSPQNTKIYFKMCQSFKSLPNFRSQLDEFLTMRRRSFLRIPNEDFPPHARVKLAKVVSFIRELFHAGIVSESHSELWTQPHLIKRVESDEILF